MIPLPGWWRIAATAALALAVFGAGVTTGWQTRGVIAGKFTAQLMAQHAADMQAMAEAAQRAEAQARTEEQRRTARVQEIADAAHMQAQQRLVEARRAAATADSLRRAAAAFATGNGAGPSDSAAAGQCEAAAARSLVLAELLAVVEQRGRAMAELADERGAAGAACQRAYESLTKLEKDHE